MPEIFGAALMGGGSGPAFAAIGAIYPAGATCTCSYGGKTITAKDTSGRALFLVPSAGQWLVKASNGGQEVEDTVSITTQGQVASVTLAFFSATIVCTFPVDCTAVTCTKDSTVLSVPSGSLSSGSYTFAIPEAGEWTLACTNGTDTDTKTVSVTEETTYVAELSFLLWLYNSGNEYEDVTGGWTTSGAAKLKRNETNMVFTATTYQQIGSACTANMIDFTDIQTLKFKIDSKYAYSADFSRVGIASSKDANPALPSQYTASKTLLAGPQDVELDVSNVTGNYYVLLSGFNTDGAATQITIESIWGIPK